MFSCSCYQVHSGFVTHNLRTPAGSPRSCIPERTGVSSHSVITLWAERPQVGPQHCALCSQRPDSWNYTNENLLVAFRFLLVFRGQGQVLPDRGLLGSFTFSWSSGPGLETLGAFLILSSPSPSRAQLISHALLPSLWYKTQDPASSPLRSCYLLLRPWGSIFPRSMAAEEARATPLLLSWAPDVQHTDHPVSRAALWMGQGNIQGTQCRANSHRSHKQQRTFQRSPSHHCQSTSSFFLSLSDDTWRTT